MKDWINLVGYGVAVIGIVVGISAIYNAVQLILAVRRSKKERGR